LFLCSVKAWGDIGIFGALTERFGRSVPTL